MEFDEKELEEKKYTEAYSEEKLFDKIMKFAKKQASKSSIWHCFYTTHCSNPKPQ